jgi:hypothetical protein
MCSMWATRWTSSGPSGCITRRAAKSSCTSIATCALNSTRCGSKNAGLFYHLQVLFERWSYQLADMIIEMNESYRQNALERGKADPEKIVIVRSGPRASEFMPVEPDLSVKRGKKHLVCYLGIMGPQDGTDIFVKAAHHIVYTRGYLRCAFPRDWLRRLLGGGQATGAATEPERLHHLHGLRAGSAICCCATLVPLM